MLALASVMLPSEMEQFGRSMTANWSYGRTDGRFPPFVAALGAACHVAVSSGRMPEFRAARAAVRVPPGGGWDRSAPVVLVGLKVTVAALVVADLLAPQQVDLLLTPWRALDRLHPAAARGAA